MSIRLRLALWYGALLSLVLAAALSLAFVDHARSHEEDVAFALHAAWEHARGDVARAVAAGADLHGIRLAAPQVRSPGAVWLLSGGVAIAAAAAADDAVLRELDPRGVPDGGTTIALASGRARVYAGPAPEAPAVRLVVAASLAELDESLRGLALTLAALGTAGVGLALAGGWALAGSALRPIAALTETARAIALSRGFTRRVAVPAKGRDELGQLARTFNEMLASLGDAYRRQQRFVSDVSHELRTPLTTIQGNAEILARAELAEPDRVDAAAHVLRESTRLSRLVDDLLVLARADAGPEPFLGKPVELDALLVECFTELRPHAGPRVRLRGLESAVVVGEADRLKQLILVLVDNALRYTPGAGGVDLSVGVEGSQAVLRVEDHGIGIDAEDVAHLFERFYRGDRARQLDPRGTGLGLAIARWIVERHGGTIALETRLPRGTRAIVRLPLASEVRETVA